MENQEWIKLNDWQKVQFPEVCPFSGLEPDTTKEYYIDDSSWLWKIIGVVLQFGQVITLPVPFHTNGIKNWRKLRTKAILRGLLIGFGGALVLMFAGVFFAVEFRADKMLNRLGIMGGGIGFVASMIAFPIWMDYRLQQKSAPLIMRKKRK